MLEYFIINLFWKSFIHWAFCTMCFIIFPLRLLSYLVLSLTTQLCFLLLLLLLFFLAFFLSFFFQNNPSNPISAAQIFLHVWASTQQSGNIADLKLLKPDNILAWREEVVTCIQSKALLAIDWWPLGGRINFSLMAWTPVCPPCIHITENLSSICLQENHSKQLICIRFAFHVHT